MPAEPVTSVSTPVRANAIIRILDEQAKPVQMANSQSGPSAVLARPQGSQSDNNPVSTQLRSRKNNFQKRPTFSRDFASLRMVVDITANEPLTRKSQRHEATITRPELEPWQPEQGANAAYRKSGETIQCLREEIQQLRREKSYQ